MDFTSLGSFFSLFTLGNLCNARYFRYIAAHSYLSTLSLYPIRYIVPLATFSYTSLYQFHVSFDTAPVWGFLLPPTLGRFWNSAAVNAWLGFALAAFRAFLRCLRFAKPR